MRTGRPPRGQEIDTARVVHMRLVEKKTNAQIAALLGCAIPTVAIHLRKGVYQKPPAGKPKLRRFTEHTPPGDPYVLAETHVAIVTGRTLYRARVTPPLHAARVLKSGMHSRKIGAVVQKGKWKGMPIHTLTLEERATCSRACLNYRDCYGNNMNWSERYVAGENLESKLNQELRTLNAKHPNGFVVRLHVLGDFYSVWYVRLWERFIEAYDALRVFGYTHWPSDTPIGAAVRVLRDKRWDRFAIRSSNSDETIRSADTYNATGRPISLHGAIVCPAQTGRTECCASCALCWATDRNIAFLLH